MNKTLIESMLRQEQDFAYELLKTLTGIDFVKPVLYIGEKHRAKFVTISSMKDFEHYFQLKMAYKDEINGIFIPEHLLDDEEDMLSERAKLDRIYCFLHENIHALLIQINSELEDIDLLKLIDGEASSDEKEKKCVQRVFCEGLAEYLAIQSCLLSNNPALKSFGQEMHQAHCDFMDKLVSSRGFFSTARVYEINPSLWQQVLVRYFTNNLKGLLHYQYAIGYWFMRKTGVEFKNLKTFILSPPSKITQLVFPENNQKSEKTAQ